MPSLKSADIQAIQSTFTLWPNIRFSLPASCSKLLAEILLRACCTTPLKRISLTLQLLGNISSPITKLLVSESKSRYVRSTVSLSASRLSVSRLTSMHFSSRLTGLWKIGGTAIMILSDCGPMHLDLLAESIHWQPDESGKLTDSTPTPPPNCS